MRLSVTQKDLLHGLQTASHAVPSRTTLPALSGILLEAADGRLKLQATDLEMGIETVVPADVDNPGSILLPARYLADIARKIPDGLISIEATPDNHLATIRWADSEFVIHGQSPDHFPGFPAADDVGVVAHVPKDSLREALEGTLFAVSQDESRPILTGVHLTLDGGGVQALSTDGFRIAHRRLDARIDGPIEPISVVAPGKNLSDLLRVMDGEGDVAVRATRNHVFFAFDELRFFTRLLDGTYPAVMDLVPKVYRAKIVAGRQALHDACERVSLLSDPLQKSFATTLSWSGGRLVLSASSAAVGRAREEIPVQAQGDQIELIFNARLLAEGLRSSRGENVVLEISGPLTAARLTSPEDEGFMYVLMPMRPSEG